MKPMTPDLDLQVLQTNDGVRLVAHCLGEGPPVLLLHGFLSNARANWINPGIAAAIAATGRRVIAPDVRGHGRSDAPTDPGAYPPDILAADILAWIATARTATPHAPLALVGYSLGARMAIRAIAHAAAPTCLVLGGMGERGITDVAPRQAHFEDSIRYGAKARNPQAGAFIQSFMTANGVSAQAALLALASQRDTPLAVLAGITIPTLVVCGERDADNGDPRALAALIPGAQFRSVPGDHLSAVGKAEFTTAVVSFLTAFHR
jgi:pimeloyl-ACP methyl ester carboxylesterase